MPTSRRPAFRWQHLKRTGRTRCPPIPGVQCLTHRPGGDGMLVRWMRKLCSTRVIQDNCCENITSQRRWPRWMPSSEELRAGEWLPVGWTRSLKRRGFRHSNLRESHFAATNRESHLDPARRRLCPCHAEPGWACPMFRSHHLDYPGASRRLVLSIVVSVPAVLGPADRRWPGSLQA